MNLPPTLGLEFSQESTTGTRRSCRRRPLQTCGVSMLAISHIAYMKLEGVNGPVGSVAKRMAALATPACPFVYAVQCHWLALLSFVDDHILAIEDKVDVLLPGSAHVFDKFDELLRLAETLPGRFDDAIDKLPSVIHRVPLLECVFTHVVSWLNFCFSLLAVADQRSSDVEREKKIVVDKNYENPNNNKELSWVDKVHQSDQPGAESKDMTKSPAEVEREDLLKRSYKEELEKGNKEEKETKEDDNISEKMGKSMIQKEQVGERIENNENEKKGKEERMEGLVVDQKGIKENIGREEEEAGMISNDDPILELFNSGWHMTAGISSGSPLESQSKLEEG